MLYNETATDQHRPAQSGDGMKVRGAYSASGILLGLSLTTFDIPHHHPVLDTLSLGNALEQNQHSTAMKAYRAAVTTAKLKPNKLRVRYPERCGHLSSTRGQ